jgi:hypothetical protein
MIEKVWVVFTTTTFFNILSWVEKQYLFGEKLHTSTVSHHITFNNGE